MISFDQRMFNPQPEPPAQHGPPTRVVGFEARPESPRHVGLLLPAVQR